MRFIPAGYRTQFIHIFWFLLLFLFASGIVGSWLVPTRLLYGFGFFIYGNLGKMVLIFVILLGLLIRERLLELQSLPRPRIVIPAVLMAFALVPVFMLLGTHLISHGPVTNQIAMTTLAHMVLITIPASLLYGVFGPSFLRDFVTRFVRSIGVAIGIALVLDILIFQVWKLWPIFSTGVLVSVQWLLSLTFDHVNHVPPYLLAVGSFAVQIEQACSGLDSLFLFTALYVMVGIVDYRRLNMPKLVYTYLPAALGMYAVNILRVYILMLIGVLISPTLAIRLFHTYAGMVLFILYFAAFWSVMYKRLLKKND